MHASRAFADYGLTSYTSRFLVVPEADLGTFAAAHADGALVIDVREPFEYVSGHVPGARLIPLARLPQHAHELPAGEPVYVICQSGRSRAEAGCGDGERGGVEPERGGTGGN